MENYWNKLKLIKYTNLFDQMKEKYDSNTAEQVLKKIVYSFKNINSASTGEWYQWYTWNGLEVSE